MATEYYEGIGRRKTSSARVRVTQGHGKFEINDKSSEEYFPRLGDLEKVLAPLRAVDMEGRLDICQGEGRRGYWSGGCCLSWFGASAYQDGSRTTLPVAGG